MKPRDMENIYASLKQEDIPWNVEAPPEALVDLFESGNVRPCRALDLGCGRRCRRPAANG